MCDRCARLAQDNEALHKSLAKAHANMQSFAYTVSHDLSSPLRALYGFADILSKKYSTMLDDKGLSYLSLLHDGGIKAQAMIQGLLDYSRIYSQGQTAEITPLSNAITAALETIGARGKTHSLTPFIGDLPACFCDRKQIEQLFEILLHNAVTYRSLTVPIKVSIEAKDTESHWIVSVTDNGIGIPPESATCVFQIFKRLHPDDVYPGLGVGLAIASRIVERHGGTISTHPAGSGGSVFVFSLSKAGPEQAITPLERV